MLNHKLIIVAICVLLPFAGSAFAGGDVDRGKALTEEYECSECHEDNLLGDGSDDFPPIAGMDPAEQIQAFKDYGSVKRKDEEGDMKELAGKLSDQDLADLAAYLATLPGK